MIITIIILIVFFNVLLLFLPGFHVQCTLHRLKPQGYQIAQQLVQNCSMPVQWHQRILWDLTRERRHPSRGIDSLPDILNVQQSFAFTGGSKHRANCAATSIWGRPALLQRRDETGPLVNQALCHDTSLGHDQDVVIKK